MRVRGIQSLHAERTKIGPGNRVALNLSGVARDDVRSEAMSWWRPGSGT